MGKVFNIDGWKNLISGLGVRGKDKRVSLEYDHFKFSEVDAEVLYAASDTAAKIIDSLPEDALREWIEFNNLDSEVKDAMTKRADIIGARQRLEECWKWGRMYGGAGIYMNVNDGRDPQDPVDEASIMDVTSLTVLSRWELIPYQINSNLESPFFGMPAVYRLQTSQPTDFVQRYIHHSRVLRFDGPMLPRRLRIQNQWWGDSVFVRALNSIKNYETANDSAVSALTDFSTGVFKIKNLADLLAAGQENEVKKRIEIANYSKSVIKALIIDAEGEAYDYVTRNLSGVKDIVDMASNRLVTTSGQPHSKFLGEGPKGGLGQGAGDSEKLDWYDFVRNQQKIVLRPRLDTLFRYMFLSKNGPTRGVIPTGWTFEFAPLWQMSDKDKADVRLKTSQADASDIQNGILDPNEVAQSRYGGQKYSMDTVINKSARTMSAPPLNPPAERTVEPATSTYPNPDQGSNNGVQKTVQTPSPGFVSRKDDTDGQVQEDKKPLHVTLISKKHAPTREDAQKLYDEMGGAEAQIDESTDTWKFRNRPHSDFKQVKAFKPPRPGVTMVFGTLKDGARESTINEPLFEQANKNWQALWSWNEAKECGPDGEGCTELQS